LKIAASVQEISYDRIVRPNTAGSVHPAKSVRGGVRIFKPFVWLEVGSGKVASAHPTHQRVTHTVRRLLSQSKFL